MADVLDMSLVVVKVKRTAAMSEIAMARSMAVPLAAEWASSWVSWTETTSVMNKAAQKAIHSAVHSERPTVDDLAETMVL